MNTPIGQSVQLNYGWAVMDGVKYEYDNGVVYKTVGSSRTPITDDAELSRLENRRAALGVVFTTNRGGATVDTSTLVIAGVGVVLLLLLIRR